MAEHSRLHNSPSPTLPSSASAGGQEVEARDEASFRISLIKGEERWQFRWDAGDESQLINRIAEMARDPNVPFDWFDAAVICKHIAQPFGSSTLKK